MGGKTCGAEFTAWASVWRKKRARDVGKTGPKKNAIRADCWGGDENELGWLMSTSR